MPRRLVSGGGVDVFYLHIDHLNTPRLITQPADDVATESRPVILGP